MKKLKLQVLISTMNQKDFSLLERMNIQTDAIIINQCDKYEVKFFDYKGNKIKWFSLNEKGVGLSRNTALFHADGDILLFADDDVVYNENYEKIILDEFKKNPKAGIIVFNLESLNKNRPEYIVKKNYKLHWYNSLRFGAFRIAVKKNNIIFNNITYSLLFGGGAKYQAGEDNLFIINCIKKRVKGIASSQHIGTVKQEESSWFKGYNEKYYFDRGALFAAMYPKMYIFLLFLINIKDYKKNPKIDFLKKYKLSLSGAKEYMKAGKNYE